MSSPSLGPESSSLFGHLETLYPLACILTSPEEASTLLRRVFERAAEVYPTDRPDDHRAWLLGLLLDEHGEPVLPSDPVDSPRDPTSKSSDSFRQEVAERVLEEALPTAMATCSVQERFLLALDVFRDADEASGLATALGTTVSEAEQLQSNAWAALRANVWDDLSEAERSLIDESLPDEALQQEVENLFTNRFPRVPTSTRAQIRRTLQRAATTEESSSTEHPDEPEDSTLAFDRLPSSLRGRPLWGSLAVLLVLGAVSVGVYFLPPPAARPSSSRPSLVAFSAQQTASVQATLETNTPSEAKAYVESTWNRRVAIPSIEGAQLRGVGQFQAGSGVEVPVLLYSSADDRSRVAIFAYSYALLDQLQPQATLEAGLRKELARSNHLVTHRPAGRAGILWRSRDDIFVAVSSSASVDSLDLRNRLRPGR